VFNNEVVLVGHHSYIHNPWNSDAGTSRGKQALFAGLQGSLQLYTGQHNNMLDSSRHILLDWQKKRLALNPNPQKG